MQAAAVDKNGAVKTFFTLIKGFVATGMLFLPKGFNNGGYLFSSLTVVASAVMTFYCAYILLQMKVAFSGSISDIGLRALGTKGKAAVDVALASSQVRQLLLGIYFR